MVYMIIVSTEMLIKISFMELSCHIFYDSRKPNSCSPVCHLPPPRKGKHFLSPFGTAILHETPHHHTKHDVLTGIQRDAGSGWIRLYTDCCQANLNPSVQWQTVNTEPSLTENILSPWILFSPCPLSRGLFFFFFLNFSWAMDLQRLLIQAPKMYR